MILQIKSLGLNYKITINRNLQIGNIKTFLGLHDEFILTKPKLWVPKNSKMKKLSKERGKNLDLAVYLLSKRIRLNGKTQRDHKELGLLI